MSRLQQETISVGTKVSLDFTYQQFKKRWGRWLVTWTITIINRFAWIATTYSFKLVIDAAVINDIANVQKWFIAGVLAYLLKGLVQSLRTYFFESSSVYLASESSDYVMSELIKKDASFYEDRFSGSLSRSVQSIGGHLTKIGNGLIWSVFPFFTSGIISVVVIWPMHKLTAFCIGFFLVLFIVVVSHRFKKVGDEQSEMVEKIEQDYSGTVNDTFTNVQTVSLFGTAKHELKLYSDISKDRLLAKIIESKAYTIADIWAITICSILYASASYTMYLGWRGGQLTVGDLLFIQAQLFESLDASWGFSWFVAEFNRTLATIGQSVGLLKEETKVHNSTNATQLKVRKGEIVLRSISYSYKSGTNALKKIDTVFEAGKSYALVGHSGAGKSTVIKLLLRMYDPVKGEISIDGQNIKNVTLESLRSSIAYVPQDPALFHRSILDNIRYAKPKASRNEVITAAKLAQCHDFVSKLKNGYDTVVGERGAKLSGGERQRVAIARAILKDAPILLLDEATSSLDSESEYLVQKALENLMKNRTSVVIAHRLSTIKRADKILVLEKGTISDSGTHEELLERPGVYKNLWERQSGARI